jgi:hypothetical protein
MNPAHVEMDRRPPMGVRISGVGAAIPPRVVSTAELEEQADIGRFGFEPGWLERVTAVRERRWAEPDVTPSDLAAAAGSKALADAGQEPVQIVPPGGEGPNVRVRRLSHRLHRCRAYRLERSSGLRDALWGGR